MDYQLEVVTIPVSDVDRSLVFYTERVGFALDVDYRPSESFRVVQLTPAGSACSIQLCVGDPDLPAGSVRNLYLVVVDIELARRELLRNGVDVGEIRHKSPLEDWQGGWAPGVDSQRRHYASFADFADPDGNTWTLQERDFGQS